MKNTIKTTSDSRSPIEVIVSAPTKLVTTEEGDSTLTTGDGIVPEFLTDDKDEKEETETPKVLKADTPKGPGGITKVKSSSDHEIPEGKARRVKKTNMADRTF